MKTEPSQPKLPAQKAVEAKPPDNGPHSARALKKLAEEKARVIQASEPTSKVEDQAYHVTLKSSATKLADIQKENSRKDLSSKDKEKSLDTLSSTEKRVIFEISGES